jgi:hypothetical protein
MKSTIALKDIEHMKDALRASLPDVKSSHRVEALARGLGWATNASMRAALAAAPAEICPDEGVFLEYLRQHSFGTPSGSLVRAFARAGVRRAMALSPSSAASGIACPGTAARLPQRLKRISRPTARRC